MVLFLKALLVGLALSIPIGPSTLLCVKNSLVYGRKEGLAAGLGAALADIVYAIVVSFGIAHISQFLLDIEPHLRLGGALFLAALGLYSILRKRSWRMKTEKRKSFVKEFMLTFSLTATSPFTLIAFLALFSTMGLTELQPCLQQALTIVGGIGIGTVGWWVFLVEIVFSLRNKAPQFFIQRLEFISSLFLIGFAILSFFL